MKEWGLGGEAMGEDGLTSRHLEDRWLRLRLRLTSVPIVRMVIAVGVSTCLVLG